VNQFGATEMAKELLLKSLVMKQQFHQ